MKLFTVCSMLFLTTFIYTQNQFVGIRSGVNLTDVRVNENLTGDYYVKPGLLVGGSYQFVFTNQLNLGVDLLYAQRGFLTDLLATYSVEGDSLPLNVIYKRELRHHYNYFNVPLKIGYSMGNKWKGFATIGICPAFLINAKEITPFFEQSSTEPFGAAVIYETKKVKAFDLSAQVELGGSVSLKEDKYRLFTSIGFQTGLLGFSKSGYNVGYDYVHFGYNITAGLNYAIQKKQAQVIPNIE